MGGLGSDVPAACSVEPLSLDYRTCSLDLFCCRIVECGEVFARLIAPNLPTAQFVVIAKLMGTASGLAEHHWCGKTRAVE